MSNVYSNFSQTYKEHCNGQKHKKKEKEKEGGDNKPARGYHSFGKLYRCELCDISCTGEQAFSAHMTGSKHNKVWHWVYFTMYNRTLSYLITTIFPYKVEDRGGHSFKLLVEKLP